MSDGPAILRAILEDPYDDLPRLAYADWLLEVGGNGDRIETPAMIRHGLENPDYEMLYIEHNAYQEFAFTSRRGFVCRVELQLDTFVEYAKQLFSTHPITEVKLTDRKPAEEMLVHMKNGAIRDQQFGWMWPVREDDWILDNRHSEPLYVVPFRVTQYFKGDRGDNRHWVNYDSREDAFADLSQACVAAARQLANLPPLPTLNANLIPRL